MFTKCLAAGAWYLSSKQIDDMAQLKIKIAKIDAWSTEGYGNNVLGPSSFIFIHIYKASITICINI
jgi:hypothetical protein